MILIGGATATGKTAVAAAVAKKLDTDLISADSMQIYRGMDIGTAKVSDAVLGVKQHCINIADPSARFTVVDYKSCAEAAIHLLAEAGKVPVIAGGTGLYFHALLYKMRYGETDNTELREQLCARYEQEGIDALYAELLRLDPASGEKIHKNNVKRVLRALEVTLASKRPFSAQSADKSASARPHRFYVLTPYESREDLYIRINMRVDAMLAEGLEREVRSLLESGVTFDAQSMQGIGYKEWKGYTEGNASLREVAEAIKQNTRRYAKRQETWFRRQYTNAVFFTAAEPPDSIAEKIVTDYKKFNQLRIL